MSTPRVDDHVVRFGQALKPVLRSISDGPRPHAAAARSPGQRPETLSRLALARVAVGRFDAAASDIPRVILADPRCTDACIDNIVSRMQQAVADLLVLRDDASLEMLMAHAAARERNLYAVVNDALVDIASWLANIILVTAEPQRFVTFDEWGGEAEVTLSLDFSLPKSETELACWVGAHADFPRERVADALRTSPVRCPQPPAAVPAPSSKPSALCSLGGGLLLGALLGNWLGDD